MNRVIQVSFPNGKSEIYDWIVAESKKRPLPLSWIGCEAVESYRHAQTHAAAHNLTVAEWMERAENAIKLLEQVMPNLTDETLAKAIMEIDE